MQKHFWQKIQVKWECNLTIVQVKFNGPIHAFENIMSLSSNDIVYIKLIEMDIGTNPNLLPITSQPYTFPLKHQEWIRKELEDLEKVEINQRCLSLYTSPVVVVSKNTHQVLPFKKRKE